MPAAILRVMLMAVMALVAITQATAQAPAAPAPPSVVTTGSTPPAEDGKSEDERTAAIRLGKVEVRGKRNLFEDQALRRKKLMEGSVPCMGCDAKPLEHIPGILETIADYGLNQVTPQAPKEQDAAGAAASAQINERAMPTNRNP